MFTPSLNQLFRSLPSQVAASFVPHQLFFKEPAGTSRGVMKEKKLWFVKLSDAETGKVVFGECAPLVGLSIDDRPDFEERILRICEQFNEKEFSTLVETLAYFPSIKFGFEMAMLQLLNPAENQLFESEFSNGNAGIPINGLIWMGNEAEMLKRIRIKIEDGFKTLKLKVGALDFKTETEIIRKIRNKYSELELEIRLDANCAFSKETAITKLESLAEFKIHSIEQPIKPAQWELMANLCKNSPIPIALDEELIGLADDDSFEEMISEIMPQFIILKPSLIGGLHQSEKYIQLVESKNIGWWATSALESNVGLSAIAQWISNFNLAMPQGLGTGNLFTNNITSPLYLKNDRLFYGKEKWDFMPLKNE